MQIKTYKSFSMQEAISQVKSEMGDDAVIISTREIKDHEYGMLAKPMVEVTAAVEYDDRLFKEHVAPLTEEPVWSLPAQTTQSGPEEPQLAAELGEINLMLKTLLRSNGIQPERQDPVRDTLLGAGIKPTLVDLLLNKLGEEASLPTVQTLLAKVIRTAPTPEQKVWTFVGTTGVGKTTTVAKIAARLSLQEKQRVAIVSLDTYRIGAVEQSRTYAKILDIPFKSATTAEEFKAALLQFKDCDVILVDTIGRSLFHSNYIPELKNYFADVDMCTFLLLPVATRDRELEQTTRLFSQLGIDRVIFTKTDEALMHGSIISHNLLFRTPIAYLTVGQRVPEDLETANAEYLVNLCLGDLA